MFVNNVADPSEVSALFAGRLDPNATHKPMQKPYEHCNSYYAATVNVETNFPILEGEHRVDVGIVGGGFTGVATALTLVERGYRVAIVEANKIGWGSTGRNGGQMTDSISGEPKLRKHYGKQIEEFLWSLRWRGHDELITPGERP